MNKKGSILLGIGALVIMVALNVGNAIDKYGIVKGSLSLQVLAQSDSSGSGSSGSGSGSGSGSSSSDEENPWWLWPIQGTTKDEKEVIENCTWTFLVGIPPFVWYETVEGKKRQCYDGGTVNCTQGLCGSISE